MKTKPNPKLVGTLRFKSLNFFPFVFRCRYLSSAENEISTTVSCSSCLVASICTPIASFEHESKLFSLIKVREFFSRFQCTLLKVSTLAANPLFVNPLIIFIHLLEFVGDMEFFSLLNTSLEKYLHVSVSGVVSWIFLNNKYLTENNGGAGFYAICGCPRGCVLSKSKRKFT